MENNTFIQRIRARPIYSLKSPKSRSLYNHKKTVTHLSSGSQNDPFKSVKLSTLHNESLTSCSSLLMREDSRVSITKNSEVQPYDSDRVSCLF